jgi:hypothetical protein
MDHREQHHQRHIKGREHVKAERAGHEHQQEKGLRKIHPVWFVVTGVVLTALALVVWMFLL